MICCPTTIFEDAMRAIVREGWHGGVEMEARLEKASGDGENWVIKPWLCVDCVPTNPKLWVVEG